MTVDDITPLSLADAHEALDGLQLVSCLAGSLAYTKEVRDKCLAVGIPALVSAPTPGRG